MQGYSNRRIVVSSFSRFGMMALLLGSCASIKPTATSPSILVYAKFPADTQAVVLPYSVSDIATLDIVPCLMTSPGIFSPISSINGTPVEPSDPNVLKMTQASPSILASRPFVVRNLHPNATYRILGKAYDSKNALISQDSTSYADVVLTNDNAPTLATLPVNLVSTPFAASTSVSIQVSGRYEYLKSILSMAIGNSQLAVSQTSRTMPVLNFAGLQGNTNYVLLVEAYKLGAVAASGSLTISIGNNTAPATQSLNLSVPYITSTFAGAAASGTTDANGALARFASPDGVAIAPDGTIYVADTSNHRIRKITPSGSVSTFAGSSAGFIDGTGTAAAFGAPAGVALDSQGYLYVADHNNAAVRKISPAGIVTTLVGNGTSGSALGTGSQAQLSAPHKLVVDPVGNIFVADNSNSRVTKITPDGVMTIVAGGSSGFADGTGTQAKFRNPLGITIDAQGNLYVAEVGNNCIRKITPAGVVTTVAGNGTAGFQDGDKSIALFSNPRGLAIDSQGNLFVADTSNRRIRRISPAGIVSTVAGNGVADLIDGTEGISSMITPYGVSVDGNDRLVVPDSNSIRISQ